MEPAKDENPNQTPQDTLPSNSITNPDDALRKLTIQNVPNRQSQDSNAAPKDHKFWNTQPVPHFNDSAAGEDGPMQSEDLDKVSKEPHPLLAGFEWVTMDMKDESEVEDVYQLLFHNYVEDDDAMFRFKYSSSFLNWALKSPGWRKEWHIGIRATTSRKLLAFISGVPITLRVKSKQVNCSEINFLCVHKKLRTKRLAPVLIREITRRCNAVGIWQAIYTAGIMLPTPVSTCRYYHRSLDWAKLYEVGFSPLPTGSTKSRQIAKYRLPENTNTNGLRKMTKEDIPAVQDLLKRYLNRMELAQEFSSEELEHWLLSAENSADDQVVWAYVIETDTKITDFFSFYCLESTVIGNEKYNSIKAAYLFYYATESAFENDGNDPTILKKKLNQLIGDALIIAKKANFDVFNALTLLDNPLFLHEQKFGAGGGKLHYYLYNYRTATIAGGIDESSNLDITKMGGVGVVML